MSDLTAAQLIEHLRVLAHSTGTPYQIRRDRMLAAATFIEQQAEQIAALTAGRLISEVDYSDDDLAIMSDGTQEGRERALSDSLHAVMGQRDKAESEVALLRQVIEDAHELLDWEHNRGRAQAVLAKALPAKEFPCSEE